MAPMRALMLKALSVLQLVRLPLALAVGSDLWLASLLARWNADAADRPVATLDLWLTLVLAGLVGGGMLGFAAGMNDLLDQRRDQATNPGRPLPAGRMRTSHATLITFGSLVTALLAAALFGDDSLRVALLAAAGLVAWNLIGRHLPALGIPMMGLAHAGAMFIPWPGQPFTMPAALLLAQATLTGTLAHRRLGKRPALDTQGSLLLALLSLACVAGLLWLQWRRGADPWPPADRPWLALLPLLALGWFGWLLRAAAQAPAREDAALLLHRALVASPPATAAAWCASLDHPVAAAAFAGTALACWVLASLAREVHAMLAAPPAWRG
jgi:4-hydroxybenzoate polyprenyltransferase